MCVCVIIIVFTRIPKRRVNRSCDLNSFFARFVRDRNMFSIYIYALVYFLHSFTVRRHELLQYNRTALRSEFMAVSFFLYGNNGDIYIHDCVFNAEPSLRREHFQS